MSKNWSLALVVAFVLGFGVKSYLDDQTEAQEQHAEKQQFSETTLFGKDNQPIKLFDETGSIVSGFRGLSVSTILKLNAY